MEKGQILAIAAVLLILTNAISFGLMAYDKHCAMRGKWRVPEKTLFLAAGCFGGLGGVLGMRLLRHKTRHGLFRVFFPVLLIVQVFILVMGAYFLMTRA